jgi:hypothetical protein
MARLDRATTFNIVLMQVARSSRAVTSNSEVYVNLSSDQYKTTCPPYRMGS